MKKYCLHITLLALTAFFAFLAACGGDEAENLNGNEWNKIQVAINDLVNENGPIVKCDESWKEGCPTYYNDPSSSSNNDGDGDGDGDDGTSSSSKPNEYSSQSDGGGDTSSADNTAPAAGDNCDMLDQATQADILSKFTCHWDPSTVKAGKDAKIIMEITPAGKAAGCIAGEASLYLNKEFRKGYAYFPVDEPIPTSGFYPKFDANAQAVSDAGKTWPTSGNLVVKGLLTCNGNGCSKDCSPLVIQEPGKPQPSWTKRLACPSWAEKKLTVGTNNLSIGTITGKECELAGTVTNNAEEDLGCNNNGALSAVDIKYSCTGGNTLAACDKAGEIKVRAVATCRGVGTTLDSLTYNIVPNPSLDGACKWFSGNNEVTGTTTGKGAVPKGQKLLNSYGRCKAGTTTINADYTLLTKDYSNSDGTAPNGVWPDNGKNGLVANHTYSSVKPNIVCEPPVNFAACPALPVVEGSACDGEINLSTICPTVNDFEKDIKWNTKPQRQGGTTVPQGCYWVESWSGNNTDKGFADISNFLINGIKYSGNDNKVDWNATKIDNGIYIYIPSNSNGNSASGGTITTGTEKPFCLTGVRKLTCGAVPTEGISTKSVTPPSTSCNDGTTPAGTTFKSSGTAFNFGNLPAPNTYSSFVASATCSGQTVPDATCSGSITVHPANTTGLCILDGFKASDVPGYSGDCASTGVGVSYDTSKCGCRDGKAVLQNISTKKLACYGAWESEYNSSSYRKCGYPNTLDDFRFPNN
jgi:hypothetical protein